MPPDDPGGSGHSFFVSRRLSDRHLSEGREPAAFFDELLPVVAEIIPQASSLVALKLLNDGSFEVLASTSPDEFRPSRTLLQQAVEEKQPGASFL